MKMMMSNKMARSELLGESPKNPIVGKAREKGENGKKGRGQREKRTSNFSHAPKRISEIIAPPPTPPPPMTKRDSAVPPPTPPLPTNKRDSAVPPPKPQPQPLPPKRTSWMIQHDQTTGREYYQDRNDDSDDDNETEETEEVADQVWAKYWSDEHGRYYYEHYTDGRVEWEKPDGE
jgi:hypothetical protein